MAWYALQHKPGQGDRALLNLQNQGVSCFYPKVFVEKVTAGKRCRHLVPLFPGYLFVSMSDEDPVWAKLRSTRGILRVVAFCGKPARIDDEVIGQIRAGLEEVAEKGGIRPGQKVELEEGPFRGIQGIFQAYDGEERAIVLISFMQTRHLLSVPVRGLKSQLSDVRIKK